MLKIAHDIANHRSPPMRIRSLAAAAGFLALAGLGFSMSASAAPSLGAAVPQPGALAEKVELVVKCWETPSGRRRCRTVYVNSYKYNDPRRYPVGSTDGGAPWTATAAAVIAGNSRGNRRFVFARNRRHAMQRPKLGDKVVP